MHQNVYPIIKLARIPWNKALSLSLISRHTNTKETLRKLATNIGIKISASSLMYWVMKRNKIPEIMLRDKFKPDYVSLHILKKENSYWI